MQFKVIPFFFALQFLLLGLVLTGPFGLEASASSSAEKSDKEAPALEDPKQITRILQQAIDEQNVELVDARIAFDKVGVMLLDNAMPLINDSLNAGRLKLPQPLPALLGSLNSSSASARRPAQLFIAAELRNLVLYGVASGYFAGNPRPQNELAALDGGLFLNFIDLTPTPKKFGPTILTSQDNNSALVLTSLTDLGSGKTYELELLLALEDQEWVVYSIENAADLVADALKAGQ